METLESVSFLVRKLEAAERRLAAWKAKAEDAERAKTHTEQWYSTRWENLAAELRTNPRLTEEDRKRFFSIIANGFADVNENRPTAEAPLNPAQLLALAHHRIDALEAEAAHWKRVCAELLALVLPTRLRAMAQALPHAHACEMHPDQSVRDPSCSCGAWALISELTNLADTLHILQAPP